MHVVHEENSHLLGNLLASGVSVSDGSEMKK